MSLIYYINRLSKHLVVMVLWIVFMGWGIWQHAQQSDQPPLYDAAGYYQKAHNFWNNFHQENIVNPLNLEPTFRPPGTVLMSYPFGFDTDYRGFYFRSVFIPIAILCVAIIVSGFGWGFSSSSRWLLVFLATYLSSLPAFYYFELSPNFPAPHYWGLVDFFLSSMAALAAAFSIRSIGKFSLIWVVAATLTSAFCVFIKPTGTIVMALICIIWLGLSSVKIFMLKEIPEEQNLAKKWFFKSILIQIIIGLPVLLLAFGSAYLSLSNLAYGIKAMVLMQKELTASFDGVKEVVFHIGLGYLFPVVILLIVLFVWHNLYFINTKSATWSRAVLYALAASSCSVFLFGIWFWIVGSGAVYQIRYFFPFLLMAAVYAVPLIGQVAQQMPRWQVVLLSLLMIAPSLNLTLLLVDRNPSPEWQKWTGVNLTSGAGGAVAEQAKKFVSDMQNRGQNIIVFSLSMNTTDAIFESTFDYARIVNPQKSTMSINRPVDWQRPTVFRKDEMLSANYWLFEPVHDLGAATAFFSISSIVDFEQEAFLFRAWASKLTTNEGVTVVSESPTARILRIDDAISLGAAFDSLVANHQWRNVFMAENVKQKISENELAALLVQTPAILEKVNFSNVFELRALSVSRTGSETTVRIWWKPLSEIQEQDWAFFIHSIDNEGKTIADHYIPILFNASLSSLDGAVLFKKITFNNLSTSESRRLAVGFVRPGQPLLTADKGTRDWNNSRIIIPLP